jgi:hypothetical protein
MSLPISKRYTDKTGDISETATVRLPQCGYVVLTPYGNNHPYDLVIEDADGQLWCIQSKTSWIDEESTVIKFATASSYNHTAKQKGWRHYRGQADYFAAYVEQPDKVYLVPLDSVGVTPAMLRPTPTKDKQERKVPARGLEPPTNRVKQTAGALPFQGAHQLSLPEPDVRLSPHPALQSFTLKECSLLSSYSFCTSSPCIGHCSDHLSTTGAPSP